MRVRTALRQVRPRTEEKINHVDKIQNFLTEGTGTDFSIWLDTPKDLDKWYDADPLIQEHQAKIAHQEELVSVLKEILDNIKWRHQNIKNMIEWRKFTSGI